MGWKSNTPSDTMFSIRHCTHCVLEAMNLYCSPKLWPGIIRLLPSICCTYIPTLPTTELHLFRQFTPNFPILRQFPYETPHPPNYQCWKVGGRILIQIFVSTTLTLCNTIKRYTRTSLTATGLWLHTLWAFLLPSCASGPNPITLIPSTFWELVSHLCQSSLVDSSRFHLYRLLSRRITLLGWGSLEAHMVKYRHFQPHSISRRSPTPRD